MGYNSGGVVTALAGAALVVTSAMTSMPAVREMTGGISPGTLAGGGLMLGAIGAGFMLARQ